MGATWIERKTNGKPKNQMWNVASTTRKKAFFASNRYWWWKVDILRESEAQKIVGGPRSAINIDRKAKSFWKEDNALRLVGSEGSGELRTSEDWWVRRSMANATDNKWSIWTMHWSKNRLIEQKSFRTRLNRSNGTYYPTRRTHQTLLLRTTTCSDRWRESAEQHFPNFEEVKKWVVHILLQRMNSCIDAEYMSWKNDGKNV